jgi:microcystin-dependent protein
MITKTTTNKNYPKPDENNSLQDDVKNIENALDMIDQDMHAVTQAIADYVDNLMVGSVTAFATNTPHEGWLECNGQLVSRTDYSRLFAKIGSTYGNGDGTDSFNLPDLRNEFIRGCNQSSDLGTKQTHQLESHQHTDPGHSHTNVHNHSLNINSSGSHHHTLHGSTNDINDFISQGYPKNNSHKTFRTSDRSASYGVADSNTNSGAHNHTGSIANNSTNTGSTLTGITAPSTGNHGSETRPRNIALMYCIKH